MRIIVTGCREWNDPHLMMDWLHQLQEKVGKPYDAVQIRHGGARGADRIMDALARRCGFDVDRMDADWDRYGWSAGPIRNADMLRKGADAVVAFKDDFNEKLDRGGTEHMCFIALKSGLPVERYSHAFDGPRAVELPKAPRRVHASRS